MNIVLRNDLIKGALISYLKSVAVITSKLEDYDSGAVEIRENEWKGTDFIYPNIRVRIIRNVPVDGDCSASEILISIEVFTQDQSSAKCDEISGIIAPYVQNRQFSHAFQGGNYHFSFGIANLVPAQDVGSLTWRSEVVIDGMVSLM